MARQLALVAIAALVSTVAGDACEDIQNLNLSPLAKPLSIEYIARNSEYWSTSCSALKPTCILGPETTEQVANIVKLLHTNDEKFAIKSGGHNPNNWFASVDGGPLIDMKKMNQVTFDQASETVRVGPGNRWDDVSGALDGSGYTVIGGRIGNVGVGGYMLGGGLSFMSTEYGWAANNILEYELVVANGSVANVNKDNYPDLFMSLKGGGNNYGIVTSYLLQAYPQGQVWGGSMLFDANNNTTPKLLAALRDFTEYYPDEKAGIILTAERTLATAVDIWIMFVYYNGPEPPAYLFKNFTDIGPVTNFCKTQSMHQLLSGNNWAVLKGSVYTIGTETSPLPDASDPYILEAYYKHWVDTSNKAQWVPGVVASIAFQPIPKRLARIARQMGGDLLDFDEDADRIIMELDYSFLLNLNYDTIDQTMRDTYEGLARIRDGYVSQGQLPAVYNPIFSNDAFYPQDYWGRLRPEKAALARRVRDEVDPLNFFKNRTAGFKM